MRQRTKVQGVLHKVKRATRSPRTFRLAWALLLGSGGAGLAVQTSPSEATEPATWAAACRWVAPGLSEPSGLVVSTRYPGVVWTLNDSGGDAELFAFHMDGRFLARVKVAKAKNEDWEDLTRAGSGELVVGDFGNNESDRRDLVVYVVEEPDPWNPEPVEVRARVPFRYQEQDRFPPRKGRSPFDAEACFWGDGRLHILTKDRTSYTSRIYRFDPLVDDAKQVIGTRERVNLGSLVTGADLHPDGRRLAVLSYEVLVVYERSDSGRPFLEKELNRLVIEIGQAEGIAWDGEDLLICNESKEVHRLGPEVWRDQKTYLPPPPAALAIRRLDSTGAPVTPLPLRWSRAGFSSPPGEAPGGIPRVEAWIGWSERGLVIDFSWPRKPARGEVAAGVMLGMDRGEGVMGGSAQPSWVFLWHPQVSRVEVQPKGRTRAFPLPHVLPATGRQGRWSARISVPAEAVPQWRGEAARPLWLNAFAVLGSDEWSWAADGTSYCWDNPFLWGEATLVESALGR